MEDETTPPILIQTPGKPGGIETTTTKVVTSIPDSESQIFKLSIRGLLCLIAVGTVCGMSICKIEIKEPLYTLASLMVGYYFGQNQKKHTA